MANFETTQFTLPVARIVWGNPTVAQIRRDINNQPIMRNGEQVKQWVFGLALPKAEAQPFLNACNQSALQAYEHGVPGNFSWKRKDGDTAVDQNGQPYRDKPGRAGCEILTVATQFKAPRIVTFHNGDYIDYQGPLKTGDYVQVVVGIVPHRGKTGQSTSVPGLYLNPLLICFVGAGEEIVSEGVEVNATAALGNQAPQMPAYAVPQQQPAPMPQQQPTSVPQQQPAPVPQQQPAHAPMPQQQPAHAPMPGFAAGVPQPEPASVPVYQHVIDDEIKY